MRPGPHLTICLLLGVLALALFGFLAHGTGPDGSLVPLDREISHSLEENGEQHPEIRQVLAVITNFGGPVAVVSGGLLIVLVLVKKRKHLLALACMIVLVGGAALNEALKHTFQRQRPAFNPPVIPPHPGWSFPSGHSMDSLVLYGLVAYLLMLVVTNRPVRWIIVAGLGLLALAIGFSRVYLGAHWPTDVLAGFAEATVWLSCWIAVIETVRRRK